MDFCQVIWPARYQPRFAPGVNALDRGTGGHFWPLKGNGCGHQPAFLSPLVPWKIVNFLRKITYRMRGNWGKLRASQVLTRTAGPDLFRHWRADKPMCQQR